MISIRKQLFGTLLALGFIIIFTISVAVNISITKHFERYIQTNITHAGDVIVKVLANLYEVDHWERTIGEELIVETYMGNFAVSVLTLDKKFIWGTSQEELLERIRQTNKESLRFNTIPYRYEDRPIYLGNGEIIGYARIGYYASTLLSNNDMKFQRDVNKTIIWCGMIILGFFTLVGIYITHLFTYHIYGISKTSIALAEGKLTTRYHCKSKIKEIETLRYSMNYLAEKLENQDVIRKRLISDVSHEIRTPLHILQSNLEAIIDGFYPIDAEQIEILYKEVVRFGKMLNNLDMLKNVEESISRMDMQSLHLNESLKDVFDSFKIVAREKRINYLLNDSETQDVRVWADRDMLKQIWMNVLSNAFKFTPKRGEITVTTGIKNKSCMIIIQDTGIGIADEDLPYVFERMYRGDKSREQYEGSGLGLTIVKKVLQLQRGKVDIESIEGQGTKITITFPIDEVIPPPSNISQKVKSYIKMGIKS